MREIKESDWKVFRQLHPVALERFCRQVLEESERLHADTSQSAYERYLALHQFFKKSDKDVARLFDDFRRSTALRQLAAIKQAGLLTEQEFARFSEETQTLMAVILGEFAD